MAIFNNLYHNLDYVSYIFSRLLKPFPIWKYMSGTQRNVWYYPKSINIVFNFSNKSFWCPNLLLVPQKITYMPICQFQLAISYFVDINTKTDIIQNLVSIVWKWLKNCPKVRHKPTVSKLETLFDIKLKFDLFAKKQ